MDATREGERLDAGARLELLGRGRLELKGRLVDASNATFVGTVSADGVTLGCVHKPVRGERPLWDFPDGTLANREVAAYVLSAASGWDVVPPTVMRDGPLGPGMCQLWVDADPEATPVDVVPRGRVPAGWRRVLDAHDERRRAVSLIHADTPELARMALFDALVNNADRKGGHVLVADGHLYGVDHGVCFHVQDKLRTVLWGWAGEPVAAADLDVLSRLSRDLQAGLGARLRHLLAAEEVAALLGRTTALTAAARFPEPGEQWPVIPWPAF